MNIRPVFLSVLLLLFGVAFTATTTRVQAQDRQDKLGSEDGEHHFQWRDDDELLEIYLKGVITFTDDEAAVESLTRGGLLRVEERKAGKTRTLEVEPASDGTLRYTYKVDGRQRAYDAATRTGIAELILTVIRQTGYNADQRVARILKQGGVDGVYQEIGYIKSSGATLRYLTALLEQGDLNTAQLQRLAREVPDRLPSSGDRSRFLIRATPYYLDNAQARTAYFDAVNTVPSSGDHTRVLLNVLEAYRPGREALVLLLQSARQIPSSGDKSRVLIGAAGRYLNDRELRKVFFDAVNTIPSSGDHARVLGALLASPDLDKASMVDLLASTEHIPSSGDKTRVLIAAAPRSASDDDLVQAYLRAAGSIESSGDQTRALSALIHQQ